VHRLTRVLLVFLVGTAATLVAQTSPWPFAPRDAAPSNSGGSIAVAFWNIRWFPGGRPNAYRGEQIKQTRAVHADIVKLNADVIGFEEVRDWENAALAIQPLAGFKVDVCSNFPPRQDQTETQQVAIVSRLEPLSAWAEPWKAGGAITPPRGFAFAAYQLAPKQLLLVYALHLKSNRGEIVENIAIRQESARQLAAHMKAMNQAYGPLGAITWVVGGDYNTAPDDARFKTEKTTRTLAAMGLKWCWENIPLENRITLPPDARFPAACFDHIYYRGATLRKTQVIETAQAASDHRAIRAEFTLP
jgi:endonuclease/exonuclease/phosphatase (EEP) superfamily protein YafD